jgi:hypothetical protein
VAIEPLEHGQLNANGIAVQTVSAGSDPLGVFCHGTAMEWDGYFPKGQTFIELLVRPPTCPPRCRNCAA